jgi:hypothetical protein
VIPAGLPSVIQPYRWSQIKSKCSASLRISFFDNSTSSVMRLVFGVLFKQALVFISLPQGAKRIGVIPAGLPSAIQHRLRGPRASKELRCASLVLFDRTCLSRNV